MCAVPQGASVCVAAQRTACAHTAARGSPILVWPGVKPTSVATSRIAVRCVTMLPHLKGISAFTCSRTNTLITSKMGATRMATYTHLKLRTAAAPSAVTQTKNQRTRSLRLILLHTLLSPPSSHHLHTPALMVSDGAVMCVTMKPALPATCAYTLPARNIRIICYGSREATIYLTVRASSHSWNNYRAKVSRAPHTRPVYILKKNIPTVPTGFVSICCRRRAFPECATDQSAGRRAASHCWLCADTVSLPLSLSSTSAVSVPKSNTYSGHVPMPGLRLLLIQQLENDGTAFGHTTLLTAVRVVLPGCRWLSLQVVWLHHHAKGQLLFALPD